MPFEQLTYKADSYLIGIGGSALVYKTGAGVTGYLPDTVYAIKDNNQQFRSLINLNDNNTYQNDCDKYLHLIFKLLSE